MGIGKALKKIRKNMGYLAKEFAEKIDIPYTTYSNYENDNREPNIENLKKISKGLNIKIDCLVNLSDSFNESDEVTIEKKIMTDLLMQNRMKKRQKILSNFDKLNNKGMDKAIDQVEMLTKISEYTDKDTKKNQGD